MKTKTLKYIFIIFATISFFQCSVKNNRWINRQYHMLNTQYNVLFHGKESLKEGERIIKENELPNYNTILPVFENEDKNATASALSEMDRAIEKAQKAISLHSITNKPRRRKGEKSEKYKEFRRKLEYNNLIDECYLLMAKAQYYKGEYDVANKVCNHLLRNYHDNKIIYETKIWYARNLMEQEKYILAEKYLADVTTDPDFPKKFSILAKAVEADIFLRQRLFEKSIPPLEFLTENANRIQNKARYHFILAQVYNQLDNNEKAIVIYKDLLKLPTTYEMKFQAQMGVVHLSNEDIDATLVDLNKMLIYKRNKNNKDQIYFAMAEVYAKNDKLEEALLHYRKAIASSVDNNNQKALAYRKLGHYYYSQENYEKAKHSYDSVFLFIDTEMPDKELITTRLKNINELFSYLNIVKKETNFQKAAHLSEKEREKWIVSYQQKLEKEAQSIEKKIPQKIFKKRKQSSKRSNRQIKDIEKSKKSTWYFYNANVITSGKDEFQHIWGNRKAEDNWRRRSKTTLDQDIVVVGSSTSPETSDKTRKPTSFIGDNIRSEIPLSENQMIASHERIKSALYSAGITYEINLDNLPKAIETYEEIAQRYPNDPFNAGPTYHLYTIYKDKGEMELADNHKNKLLNNYGNSIYAQLINNPDFLKKKESEEKKAALLYKEAFESYTNFEYIKLVNQCIQALEQYPYSALKPKFLFLKAMGIAQTQNVKNLEAALNEVLSAKPEPEIKTVITNILSQLENNTQPQQFSYADMQKAKAMKASRNWQFAAIPSYEDTETAFSTLPTVSDIDVSIYEIDEKDEHYFVIILPIENALNTRRSLYRFNKENFKNTHLKEKNFDMLRKVILVQGLQGKPEALAYLNQVIQNNEVYSDLASVDYRNFVISTNNFEMFMIKRDIPEYLDFYVNNYFGQASAVKTTPIKSPTKTSTPEKIDPDKKKLKLQLFKKKKDKSERDEKKISSTILENETIAAIYSYDPDAEHYFVLLFPIKGVNVNYLWTAIYHQDRRYRVNKVDYTKGQKMLITKNIGKYEEAMAYFKRIIYDDNIYSELQSIDYRNFIISKENLDILSKQKALKSYIDFFKKYYLNQ